DEQLPDVGAEAEDRPHVGGRGLTRPEAERRRVVALPPAALEGLDARAAQVAAATLDDVFLVQPAATAPARGRAAVNAAARPRGLRAGAAEAPGPAAQREDRAGVEVDTQLRVVTVRDRTPRIRPGDAEHAAGRPQLPRLADAHALRQAEVDRQRRAVGEGDERAARLDEPLQVEHTAQSEAATHVVRR